jgi:capsule assembly protein Wzi
VSHGCITPADKRARYWFACAVLGAGMVVPAVAQQAPKSHHAVRSAEDDGDRPAPASAFLPVDSWIYGALERLAALGYVDTAFLGLRPWTRSECARLIEEAEENLDEAEPSTAQPIKILHSLQAVFAEELKGDAAGYNFRLDSLYAEVTSIAGPPLNNSYHFGQTVVNNFGRPYAQGFNQVSGFSGTGQAGRFTLYVRGEFQHAPGVPALSDTARTIIAAADATPIQPASAIPDRNQFRLLEAYASTRLAGMQFTFGRQNLWWGPGESGAMILSNNAAPFTMFRITPVSAFKLPSVLRYLGPMRFDSFFGRLAGHHFPPEPFFHGQKISLKPTPNLEFGFSRTAVFAGQGVTPLTFSTFFHSFFSVTSGTAPGFNLRQNPGARHANFDFSYRIPGLRRWLTLYSDSVVHDDVSPISAATRAAINPGLYLSRVPKIPKLDLRVEAVNTDPPVARSMGGKFIYWEGIYRDAHTNQGNLLGNWIGREGKGGQAWMTYWLGPASKVQLSYRRAKIAKDFIPGGSTQDDFSAGGNVRLRSDLDVSAYVQYERWKLPALAARLQSDVLTSVQVTWLPQLSLRRRHGP